MTSDKWRGLSPTCTKGIRGTCMWKYSQLAWKEWVILKNKSNSNHEGNVVWAPHNAHYLFLFLITDLEQFY